MSDSLGSFPSNEDRSRGLAQALEHSMPQPVKPVLTYLSTDQIEFLADIIYEKAAGAFLRLPLEHRAQFPKEYVLPPVQIPNWVHHDEYYLLHIRFSATGSLVARIQDYKGVLVKEWIME